ncbi:hypothetical protein B1R94_17450 [Mycolicibacterium litorale]|nr:hypothetical protein B1R94_17450 [Mycolicibacterium litorale]
MSDNLPAVMEQLTELLGGRLAAIIERTSHLVEIDSGSNDPDGVNAVVSVIETALSGLGFTGRHHEIGPDRGRLFSSSLRLGDGARVLILGHADTVWPRGTAAQWPFDNDGTRLSGPGVGDMKCALSMAVEAISAAIAVAPHQLGEITYALVPDEELGSVGSRAAIEEWGRAADLCLTLEAGAPGGGTITSRGAVGAMVVRLTGRTSHSTDPSGISALSAAARLVTAIEALTDRAAGLICTVGILNAGTARQVVPGCAELHIDLRAPDTSTGHQLTQRIRELATTAAAGRLQIEVLGVSHVPPWLPTVPRPCSPWQQAWPTPRVGPPSVSPRWADPMAASSPTRAPPPSTAWGRSRSTSAAAERPSRSRPSSLAPRYWPV